MEFLKKIEALFITNPTNIRYLTGFVGVDKRDAYLLLANNKKILFTTRLYNGIPLEQLPTIIKKEKIKKLAFEETDVTVAEYETFKRQLRGVTLVPTKNRIEDMRMIKRDDEIANIRQASKLTDECFVHILPKLTPTSAKASAGRFGVEEGEIAWEIEAFFRKRGATAAFSPVVAFGKNTSQPHYQLGSDLENPKSLTLSSTDIALLDFGAKVNGYCADMTRVVFIGKPKDEWEHAYQTVLEAQKAALNYLHLEGVKAHLPGGVQLSGAQADRVAREVIKKAGFPVYPHSLGHSVGLAIHEAPRLTIRKDANLLPNMVITIEPAIYIEDQYGIRIEDLVLLKKDAIEVLSKANKEFICL